VQIKTCIGGKLTGTAFPLRGDADGANG